MNKFKDSWDNFSRYMMIFDFLIPYREFGSLPGYHAITFEPLRGNLRYSYNFLTLCFINIPQRGKYLHDQWIKGKSFQRRKTRVNIGDLEGESKGAVDSRRSAVGGPGLFSFIPDGIFRMFSKSLVTKADPFRLKNKSL